MPTTSEYYGFKLICLDLRENSLVGTILYEFIENTDKADEIYTSVIIGENGTGKSNLFRIVILLFKELYDLGQGRARSYNVDGRFSLKYSFKGTIFQYSNIAEIVNDVDLTNANRNQAFLTRNGEKVSFEKALFPRAIVANSIMLTDKYPIYNSQEVFPNYKYLGVRNRPQVASTRSYVRKTVEFIVEKINSDVFSSGIIQTAKFLGINGAIDVIFYTLNSTAFFKGTLDRAKLIKYFNQIDKKYKEAGTEPPFKLSHFKAIQKHKSDFLDKICALANRLYDDNRLTDNPRSSAKTLTYNVVDERSHRLLKKEYLLLDHMRKLGMLSAPEINLNRGDVYSLQESSSGEYHFFSSMIGLLATVENDSLIFIDEPEISLHPNWQMRYLSFVRKLFSGEEYRSCHLIVATHSHFVISDLRGETSKIIGLRKSDSSDESNKNKIEIVDLPYDVDTFCWSPDDVLYNIFNVTSSRNKFVAEEIATILDKLSTGSKSRINKLDMKTHDTLIHLSKSLKESDPLREVVMSILKRIK
jgi:predicted ATPase